MDLCAYLERIGYGGEVAPRAEVLCELHRRNLRAIPFENLDIHLGRPIVLDESVLFEKLIRQRRGGFCYELNGLFAALLRKIGFDLDLLSARVAHQDGSFGREFDHLLLLVRIDGEEWIADVGFGDSFLEPLRLIEAEQDCNGSVYLIEAPPEKLLLMRYDQGQWRQQYLFTRQPRRLDEFAEMCIYHQTSPLSSFTRGRVCTRATCAGRITLSEMRLIETGGHGRTERVVESDAEYLELLEQHFGIVIENPVWRSPIPVS